MKRVEVWSCGGGTQSGAIAALIGSGKLRSIRCSRIVAVRLVVSRNLELESRGEQMAFRKTAQILRNEAAAQVTRFAMYPGFPGPGSSEKEELITAFMEASLIAGKAKLIGDYLMRNSEFAPRPKNVWDAATAVDEELAKQAAPTSNEYSFSNRCDLCQDTGFVKDSTAEDRHPGYSFVKRCQCRREAIRRELAAGGAHR
jgi:hypothetical protein